MTTSARFIICEKTGNWAAASRRVLGSVLPGIVETRSLTQCWQQLAEAPVSLVAFELTPANVESLLKGLVNLTAKYPQARAIVFGSRGMESYEWIMREAGAIEALYSPRSLHRISSLVERFFLLAPKKKLTFRESVWERLPWKSA